MSSEEVSLNVAEQQSAEQQSAEQQSTEQQPAEQQPAEQSAEQQPAEQSAEQQPAEQAVPADAHKALMLMPIEDQNAALNGLIGFVGIAQRRGCFALDEAAKAFECIKMFHSPSQ
jgi:hypothetical protein